MRVIMRKGLLPRVARGFTEKNENGDIVQKATKENRNEIVQKAKNVIKDLSGVLSPSFQAVVDNFCKA